MLFCPLPHPAATVPQQLLYASWVCHEVSCNRALVVALAALYPANTCACLWPQGGHVMDEPTALYQGPPGPPFGPVPEPGSEGASVLGSPLFELFVTSDQSGNIQQAAAVLKSPPGSEPMQQQAGEGRILCTPQVCARCSLPWLGLRAALAMSSKSPPLGSCKRTTAQLDSGSDSRQHSALLLHFEAQHASPLPAVLLQERLQATPWSRGRTSRATTLCRSPCRTMGSSRAPGQACTCPTPCAPGEAAGPLRAWALQWAMARASCLAARTSPRFCAWGTAGTASAWLVSRGRCAGLLLRAGVHGRLEPSCMLV